MRNLTIQLLILAVGILFGLAACGGGKHTIKATGLSSNAIVNSSLTAQQEVFTEEDRMLMAMPYEQRLRYLEKKYRDLIFQMYGVVFEEQPEQSKGSSDAVTTTGLFNIEENDGTLDERQPAATRFLKDNLQLNPTTVNGREWTLSFRERLQGDFNFDHEVRVSDITPLAMHMGHEVANGTDEFDAHIDRNGNDDGVIGVQDVTPLAQNFLKTLTGYEVYHRQNLGGSPPQYGAPRLLTVWNDTANRSPETYRDRWMDAIGLHPPVPFTRKGIYDRTQPNPILVAADDIILVRPMFGTSRTPSQIDSEEVPFTLDLARQQTIPVAAISASNTNPRRNQIIQLDGSASQSSSIRLLRAIWLRS